jgi:LemA protein
MMNFLKKHAFGFTLLSFLLVCICCLIVVGNNIARQESNVDEAYANIETQLQRRNDLIPSLVEVVKGYAGHEAKIFEEISSAQVAMNQANSVSETATASNQLTSAYRAMIALQVNYPEIKADKQFVQLSDELAGTENRLAVARTRYNKVVKTYNTEISLFPGSTVASVKGAKKIAYFKADEAAKTAPKISFDDKSE